MANKWCQMMIAALMFMVCLTTTVKSQPQTNLLITGCSQINATNLQSFFSNLNETFRDIRIQLSNNTYFATSEQTRNSEPVYVLAQCRNYMSTNDCLSCFDTAREDIRTCAAANGARVVLDGCFLRYESNSFYDQTTLPGNQGLCGNITSSQQSAFETVVDGLLYNLSIATPKINNFYAAATAPVSGTNTSTAYAIAQCAETVTKDGCDNCLKVAYANIKTCATDVTDGRAVDSGCFMRYSASPFFANNKTIDIAPFLLQDKSSSNKGAIIGGIVGGVGFLIILLIVLLFWYRRSQKTAPGGSLYGATELQGPKDYSYGDLKKATKDFKEENKLGEGGFGDVFKGTVTDGNVIAVKRLALGSNTAKDNFESEVRVISNVHHRNLIRLLGCCSKGPELLLVLEYMANGSLEKFLYGEKKGTLNWKQRCDIIFGTARGLAYLHEQYHVTIIHRDIKPSNILLDNDFQPKIADFGLARLLPEDQTHISTRFAGTLGYTAPEYAIHGQLSEKVDTYSFGIVALEIISGKKCTDIPNESAGEQYLLEHAWNLYDTRMHLKLVDETLNPSEYREDDIKKIIEIALMCTQSPVSVRPTMSEVVMLLSDRSRVQNPPSRQNVDLANIRIQIDNSSSTTLSISNADATITELTGR
ncbi:cysteine-rich receptor-like protein kinase 2 [Rutidosis leptorrhynchoides]|uniref:cysteine-rich receptor-like protein kinase 2 n=1 Tax=Rutidosis leptorrhynchoides TaxID=125765 RepID=UPI003A996401